MQSSPSKYCRIAFAQIAANPAYVDPSGISHLNEPVFQGEDRIGLYSLAGIKEINEFRSRIAATFTTHIFAKIETILAFAANEGVELLVFPEYSIPSSVLPDCKALSDELNIAVVAGSHLATQFAIRSSALP